MAIFKVPRITTSQRQNLILQIGEIVYDTDQDIFYGGDDETLGGFTIGKGAGDVVERIELEEENIFNKFVTLGDTPVISQNVTVTPEGGITQVNGIDFRVVGNTIRWDGMGLDGVLDKDDSLIVQY
jgi:hypothetical protein